VPILIGGAIGVPIGGEILRWASPASLRIGIGVILIAFSLYSLIRPRLGSTANAGKLTDGGIAIVNGVVGVATGLAGIVLTTWCSLRGWPPPEQRAVFQPSDVLVFLLTAIWLGGRGTIVSGTIELFLIGLPALAVGTWAGMRLFGKLDDTGFRRVVMALLLVSGLILVVFGR